jgi:hypothetical protein
MRARVQRGDHVVNGGEGRVVAWPGGEAAMAPQARRGDDGEGDVRAGDAASEVRGVRTRAGVDGKAQQGSSTAAAGQPARRCSGTVSSGARVLCRARREEERGDRKRVERERERSTC